MNCVRKFLLSILAPLLISGWCTHSLLQSHINRPNEIISSLVELPETLVGAVCLEFDRIVADYLLLKTMIYLGEKMERKERPGNKEWALIYRSLQQITNLDPRFLDPYVLAAMTFPWEAGMIPETCALLEKAVAARGEDYRPYFFLWFIKSYFEKDASAAAHYMKLASTKQGAPQYLATLAARLDLYAGNTISGILFLEEMLEKTSSQATRQFLEKRIDALKRIAFLEEKVTLFKQRFGTYPSEIKELISSRILIAIPPDPYGGQFFIRPDGRVYTTSKLVDVKNNQEPR